MLKDVESFHFTADRKAELRRDLDDREDPVKTTERERVARERAEAQQAVERRLRLQGLAALGGDGATWTARREQIEEWWAGVKAAEAGETWAGAYAANRLSARQIGANHKDALGLHDLSASLLDGSKPTVLEQLKHYGDAIVVFMPVPSETDAQVFHAISTLAEPDEPVLRGYRNNLTRVRLAQGSDMHTIFVDDGAGPPAPVRARYGITGRVQRAKGAPEVLADEVDIDARRTNALQHSKILGAGATQAVNEIVVAYRKHASPVFPCFAKWDQATQRFNVLKDGNPSTPTGAYITNTGTWHDA
ncbi:hypothetical protein [Actinokineospora bangkokensis]|uniref:Uncharacterized protein n=1 Tax=Actinokineospora bangkokensis TaxID=1193682 RepID=A0A1Q9LIH4_9PSEU|nr:hypothetical protein [Actinokineospora bangkokensis]OLR91828.1 hypothetical protein BJP25_23595 [Actinokineospora bangkokensis]